MSNSALSSAKRHRAVVHDKQPTFNQRAHQAPKVHQAPKKLPTANELILLHEICIREMNAKIEKMEHEINLLKLKHVITHEE
jgi:hypothetical protein